MIKMIFLNKVIYYIHVIKVIIYLNFFKKISNRINNKLFLKMLLKIKNLMKFSKNSI